MTVTRSRLGCGIMTIQAKEILGTAFTTHQHVLSSCLWLFLFVALFTSIFTFTSSTKSRWCIFDYVQLLINAFSCKEIMYVEIIYHWLLLTGMGRFVLFFFFFFWGVRPLLPLIVADCVLKMYSVAQKWFTIIHNNFAYCYIFFSSIVVL